MAKCSQILGESGGGTDGKKRERGQKSTKQRVFRGIGIKGIEFQSEPLKRCIMIIICHLAQLLKGESIIVGQKRSRLIIFTFYSI